MSWVCPPIIIQNTSIFQASRQIFNRARNFVSLSLWKSIFRIFIFHEMLQKVYHEYLSVVYTMKLSWNTHFMKCSERNISQCILVFRKFCFYYYDIIWKEKRTTIYVRNYKAIEKKIRLKCLIFSHDLYLFITSQFYGNHNGIFVLCLIYEQIFVLIFQVGLRNFRYFI